MSNERELTIDELDAISGGAANDLPKEIGCNPGTLVCCPPGGCDGGGTKDPIGVWNSLLRQYGAA